jgi:crotonobetainyl-CoA:carnitine CoA-transferase CaiB-like acyl-CoA transferase
MDHPLSDDLRQVANPMRFTESTIVHDKHPPLLGEHTSELLRELGFDDAAIDNLKRTGVV